MDTYTSNQGKSMVADDDEDDFESIIEIVYNEVMQHPSIKFDELVADHLKLETHYLRWLDDNKQRPDRVKIAFLCKSWKSMQLEQDKLPEMFVRSLQSPNKRNELNQLIYKLKKKFPFTDSDDKLENFENVGGIFFNESHLLGKGSRGTVVCKGKFGYSKFKRDVAVKKYQRSIMSEADNQIVKLLQVDYHPHIVQYFGVEYTKDFCYLALQQCQASLEQYVKGTYQNPKVEAKEILKDIFAGLSHLHNLSPPIVHRDVKASNALIFAPNSKVKPIGVLSDLGLSKQLKESRDSVTMTYGVGTFGYMAPELLLSEEDPETCRQKVSVKIDIFASGCLSYYALSNGHHPFGANAYLRNGNIINNQRDLSHLAGDKCGLKQLISKMIAVDPEERPNASDVVHSFIDPSVLKRWADNSDRVNEQDELLDERNETNIELNDNGMNFKDVGRCGGRKWTRKEIAIAIAIAAVLIVIIEIAIVAGVTIRPQRGNIILEKIHGGWGEYNVTDCDKLCGGGTQKKVKACNNPPPGPGGDNCTCDTNEICDGLRSMNEYVACNLQPCPVNCEWDEWKIGECDKSCVRTNTRIKKSEAKHGGEECEGSSSISQDCNVQDCVVHCEWSEWRIGECNLPCGRGSRTNSRRKEVEAKNGGRECKGPSSITEHCNIEDCPVHCEWGEWRIGKCDRQCGGGKRTKSRTKNVEAKNRGRECRGSSSITEDCNVQDCSGWLIFQSLEKDFYIGDPRPHSPFWPMGTSGRANRRDNPGKHMIEDMNGDNPKLKDLQSGMKVKIKAYQKHSNGDSYLYTSKRGNVYYDKRQEGNTVANNKQKWIIHFNESTNAIRFESEYWRGKYLNGKVPCDKTRNFGKQGCYKQGMYTCCWLEVNDEKYTWWEITYSK